MIKANKPRPRFVEALDSEDDSPRPFTSGKRDAGSNGGGAGVGLAGSGGGHKKYRKSGAGKQSFFTGLGFPSAGGFRNYRFLGFGSGGEDPIRLPTLVSGPLRD